MPVVLAEGINKVQVFLKTSQLDFNRGRKLNILEVFRNDLIPL